MACRAIQSWTFCSLVGAFLDLALAYFMLCGAACAFLAAKFVGVFGLRLPCPCGGLFGCPSGWCLNCLLVDYPPRMVSSVQMSVRSRFPFDSVWAEEEIRSPQFKLKYVKDGPQSNRLLEMAREDTESCGSISNLNVVGLQNLGSDGPSSVNEGDRPETMLSPRRWRGASVKGKGVLSSLKPRPVFRCRRRTVAQRRQMSSILPFDTQLGWQAVQHSYLSMSEQMQENSGNDATTSIMGDHYPSSDNLKPSEGVSVAGEDIPPIGSTQQITEWKVEEKDKSAPGEYALERNEVDAIRMLEQELKEEQAARSALYLELEKERSAAATAADEAMSMILRLQKEKASIEMEARQYRRMIEEKTAYDEEEMNILKEIIVRREREKHVLEKEVEMYRQMMVSGDGSEQWPQCELHNMIDMIRQKPSCSSEFTDGAEIMLQQFSGPITEKGTSNFDNGYLESGPASVVAANDDIRMSDCVSSNKCEQVAHSIEDNQKNLSGCSNERQTWGLAEEKHYFKHGNDERFQNSDEHQMLKAYEECHLDFQEKGMLTVDVLPSSWQSQTSRYGDDSGSYKLNKSQEDVFHNEASDSADKFRENCVGKFGPFSRVVLDWEDHPDTGDRSCMSCPSQLEAEQSIHDVHVIDNENCKEQNRKGSNFSQAGSASANSRINDICSESDGSRKVDISRSHSSNSWLEAEQDTSASDLTKVLLPADTSHYSSFSELRRNSMTVVDKERLKLEIEVECLRERLKTVQQGRKKLNFSVENNDREKFQLQLLEEIASELREIQKLTEPRKASRQVSLPPSSLKSVTGRHQPQINLKKRRCQSVPWGVYGST